jgi:cobalt-zinc-cadmium efflux system protein
MSADRDGSGDAPDGLRFEAVKPKAGVSGCGHGHDHAGEHDHDHDHDHEHEHEHGEGNGGAGRRTGHHHHHGHHHHNASGNLMVALALNLGFSLIELVGGLWTGSVAILSDAVHDFGDSLSLGLAYVMERMAKKRSDENFSYGYRRISLLSALITSTFLLAASAAVLVRAIPRLMNPVMPKLEGMIGFAIVGIAVNGYAALRLQRGSTMNERVVSWHLVEDVLGWVAVLVGAVVMSFVDAPIIDPILSIGFTLFIVVGVFRSLRATLRLFLQATPEGVDMAAFRREVGALPGVKGTHDTHFWSLDGEAHVLTIHVVVADGSTQKAIEDIKSHIRRLAARRGKIHTTIEIEIESETETCPVLDCVQGT